MHKINRTVRVQSVNRRQNNSPKDVIQVPGNGDLQLREYREGSRANKIEGCLNDTIWRNRRIRIETKVMAQKATVRLIMTYMAETRPDTSKKLKHFLKQQK